WPTSGSLQPHREAYLKHLSDLIKNFDRHRSVVGFVEEYQNRKFDGLFDFKKEEARQKKEIARQKDSGNVRSTLPLACGLRFPIEHGHPLPGRVFSAFQLLRKPKRVIRTDQSPSESVQSEEPTPEDRVSASQYAFVTGYDLFFPRVERYLTQLAKCLYTDDPRQQPPPFFSSFPPKRDGLVEINKVMVSAVGIEDDILHACTVQCGELNPLTEVNDLNTLISLMDWLPEATQHPILREAKAPLMENGTLSNQERVERWRSAILALGLWRLLVGLEELMPKICYIKDRNSEDKYPLMKATFPTMVARWMNIGAHRTSSSARRSATGTNPFTLMPDELDHHLLIHTIGWGLTPKRWSSLMAWICNEWVELRTLIVLLIKFGELKTPTTTSIIHSMYTYMDADFYPRVMKKTRDQRAFTGSVSRVGRIPWSLTELDEVIDALTTRDLSLSEIRGAVARQPEAFDQPWSAQKANPKDGKRLGWLYSKIRRLLP
ncbi:MAG: hypothetical protein AAFV53_11210, partial [Myxococcota bacterium]